jgi:hypothetical protein
VTALYWISHPDHTDMFTQGYIGVSGQLEKRWEQHYTRCENPHLQHAINKYGWDNLVKKVILIANKQYCLDVEKKLRPIKNIGWNIAFGGGMPPNALGKKFGPMSEETKAKLKAKKIGKKRTQEEIQKIVPNLLKSGLATRFKKGYNAEINNIISLCKHCGKTGKGPAMLRWHMDNCKLKGATNV